MAKNLLEITPQSFELMIFKVSTKQLMALYKDIFKYKRHDIWKKLNPEYPDHFKKIDDIERKTTMIEKELMRRGYIQLYNIEERQDYVKWVHRNYYKRSVF